MAPVRLIVVGAGSRGAVYAAWAREHPEAARVVAVAEPREALRARMVRDHAATVEHAFADAVVLATPDALHAEPAIAFAGLGYHLLLEKPMAPTAEECRRIVAAVEQAGVIFAVCHVLRYTRYTETLKQLVDEGRIGSLVSVAHLEPVGYWHQAHSFVRGNWASEARSSSMLLQKSCHDLDWLRHVVGRRCVQVSSFGSLVHFVPQAAPPGAAARCLDCPPPIETRCPYSARKIYLGRVDAGYTGWPVDVLTTDLTREGVTAALRTGPYGRCVYACDNDVVDHQVVNLLFEGGITGSFTMTGFTRGRDRETRLFGTHGELYGNGRTIELHDFLTDRTYSFDVNVASDGTIVSGHGGGDARIMEAFVAAVATGDRGRIRSGPAESLESHLMVFAAEASRKDGTTHAVG
jgi:predicted dehydrogenase